MTAMGATFGTMWRHATAHRRLVIDALSDSAIRRSTFRFRIGAPVYLLSMLVALISAPASLAIVAALAVYYVLPAGGAVPQAAELEGGAPPPDADPNV